MELSRRNLVNIARQLGVEPGHMGKEKLRKATLEKIEQIQENSRREALKPTPETIERLFGRTTTSTKDLAEKYQMAKCPFCGSRRLTELKTLIRNPSILYCCDCGNRFMFF